LLRKIIFKPTNIEPLITFRILFGALMMVAALRFMWSGWIEKLYVEPQFFFKFYGFEWIDVPNSTGIYILYGVIVLSAALVMLGLFYRVAIIAFFLSFTYSELLDATNYLNHYYLVCVLSFLLIFLPANRAYSLDIWRKPELYRSHIPSWCINILILQLGIVYFYAGFAKLNNDWLFHALPMAIWLPERADFPILGTLFQHNWIAYAFSWFGAIYDLTITFFLLNKKTRPLAYIAVLIFHIMTKLLFNIGLFPFIMIFSTLIFFSADFHKRLLSQLKNRNRLHTKDYVLYRFRPSTFNIPYSIFLIFFAFQLLFPLRHYLYSGNVLWTEEGYRFSWRVMLVEKSGLATFRVKDGGSIRQDEVQNSDYLTPYQEKQMAIQPDFILQFAHHLAKEYEQKYGFLNPIVTVDSHVALNGRTSRRFIDPEVNLAEVKDHWGARTWVLR